MGTHTPEERSRTGQSEKRGGGDAVRAVSVHLTGSSSAQSQIRTRGSRLCSPLQPSLCLSLEGRQLWVRLVQFLGRNSAVSLHQPIIPAARNGSLNQKGSIGVAHAHTHYKQIRRRGKPIHTIEPCEGSGAGNSGDSEGKWGGEGLKTDIVWKCTSRRTPPLTSPVQHTEGLLLGG